MLQIHGVSKIYTNGQKALEDVSISIQEGEFVALLGPNGAGKSTVINILGGNVIKSEGEVAIAGFDLDREELETKKRIGIVPQEISFDSFFTVNEVLLNQSGYFGIKDNQDQIDEILKGLHLYDKKDTNTKALSGGMKRRLLIAKALVHNPDIIILDEPTAGVDIELRQQLYTFLQKLHKQGKTIILTTHYLEEAEELCDRIIVINKGKIVADDSKKVLMNSLGEEVLIEIEFSKKVSEKDFEFLNMYKIIAQDNSLKINVPKNESFRIFAKLSNRNIQYLGVKIHELDLEDIFLKLVQ